MLGVAWLPTTRLIADAAMDAGKAAHRQGDVVRLGPAYLRPICRAPKKRIHTGSTQALHRSCVVRPNQVAYSDWSAP